MKIYVLVEEVDDSGPFALAWSYKQAVQKSEDFQHQGGGPVSFYTVELPPLSELVDSYFEQRKMKDPDAQQAFNFLVSEVGELADALVSQEPGWVRNHPDEKANPPANEASDVLMMLVKTCEKLGFDPLSAMVEKFRRKGWRE